MVVPNSAIPLSKDLLGSTKPKKILYEAEEPIVFTLETPLGQHFLAYLTDVTTDARWLLLTYCEDELVDDLERGRVPLRDVLLRDPWTYIARLGNDDEWQGIWAVRTESLPEEHLPRPGTMLATACPDQVMVMPDD